MGFIPQVAAGVGTAVSLLSQRQGLKTDRALSKLEERRLRAEAVSTRAAATEEQFLARQDLKRTVAENIARTAAGGVQQVGSPLMANLLAIDNAATNIGIIGFNVEREVRGLESAADIVALRRKFDQRAGKISQFSTALGGLAQQAELDFSRRKRKGTIAGQKRIPRPSTFAGATPP